MECRFCKNDIISMIEKQLSSFYILCKEEKDVMEKYYNQVILKVENCFSKNNNKYYHIEKNGTIQTYFDPLHTCQWFIFLSTYANTVW